MRVSKKHDVHLNEILDVSEDLFASKGYEKTTVNDILDGVGIGKGTFYYYFKSKEDVMYAVITRMANLAKTFSQDVADMPGLSANEKILKIFSDQPGRNDGIVEQLHHEDNSAMHLRSLIETVHAISPAMTRIIEQGIAEGVFNTPYPRESFEFLFAGAQFMLDLGLYKWTQEELLQKTKAFTHVLEIALGAEKGCFEYIYKMNEAAVYEEINQQRISK